MKYLYNYFIKITLNILSLVNIMVKYYDLDVVW